MDKYTYRVTWSEEDGEYVGLCDEFPSLSWLAKSQKDALAGVQRVVHEVLLDMKTSGAVPPQRLATRRYSGKFKVRIPPGRKRFQALVSRE